MTLQCDRIALVETLQGCKKELFEEPGTSLNQEQMPVVTILIETNKQSSVFILLLYYIIYLHSKPNHSMPTEPRNNVYLLTSICFHFCEDFHVELIENCFQYFAYMKNVGRETKET